MEVGVEEHGRGRGRGRSRSQGRRCGVGDAAGGGAGQVLGVIVVARRDTRIDVINRRVGGRRASVCGRTGKTDEPRSLGWAGRDAGVAARPGRKRGSELITDRTSRSRADDCCSGSSRMSSSEQK